MSRLRFINKPQLSDELVYLGRQNWKAKFRGSIIIICIIILKLHFHSDMPSAISAVEPQRAVSPSNAFVLLPKYVFAFIF